MSIYNVATFGRTLGNTEKDASQVTGFLIEATFKEK